MNNIHEISVNLVKRINSTECWDHNGTPDGYFNESTATEIVKKTLEDITSYHEPKPLSEVAQEFRRLFVWFGDHWKMAFVVPKQDKLFKWNVGKPYNELFFIGSRNPQQLDKYASYLAVGIPVPNDISKTETK